jgi:hypothetical protein
MSRQADLPDPARRALSLGLGLFPMLPLLPGCSGTIEESGQSTPAPEPAAQGGGAATTAGSSQVPVPAPAPTGAPVPAPVPAPAPEPAAAPARTAASVSGVFRHPGLLVTEDDFTRIRECIKTGQQPWTDWWNKLCVDSAASLDGKPNPQVGVYRADSTKYAMYRDIQRAWCLALRWRLSDDTRYADKAVETLDAWANTLQVIGTVPPGSTAHDDHTFILLAGMQGHQWAQSGEILRGYSGWPAESLARFQDMLLRVFAGISEGRLKNPSLGSHANWDMSSLCGALAIGVFCDRPDLYRLACDYYAGNNRGKLTMFGNGSVVHSVYYMHPGHMGQWEESGRDQGHSTLGMSLGGDLLEMAWNQGDDLYGMHNNRFLAAAEYVARSNLLDENGNTYPMPYAREQDPSQPHTWLWTQVNQSFQHGRNAWEPIFNHYVNRMGLAAPNVARMVVKCEPNYWSGNGDDMVFPTLTHRRPAYAGPMKPPSGLTVVIRDGQAVLSWWGSVGATSYLVKRAAKANGPFTALATLAAGELLTYTDAPPSGTWFYQVAAQGSTRLNSATVRAAMGGETRLSMPLNGLNGTGTVGALLNSDGTRVAVQGTLLNGATWGDGRLNDQAVVFDGQTSGLQLPPGVFSGLDDFSVSMWAYANALHWDSCLFFSGNDGFGYMRIAPQAGRGGLRFAICAAGFNDEQPVEAASPLPTRRWVHVAVTLQGGTGRLYVDGTEVARSDTLLLSPRQVGDQVTFLGRNWAHPSFNGRIQDFRVQAGALSAAEVAALAQ